MDKYQTLINDLENAKGKFKSDIGYRIGLLSDNLLKNLVENIRINPRLDEFLVFTNCLNFFYSTRLQGAVKKDTDTLNTKSKIIFKVAELLHYNWNKGIRLSQESQSFEVDKFKVQQLRELLNETLERETYSFTTKVFHQLNNKYPIIDTNVTKFMKIEGFLNKINIKDKKVPYSTFLELYYQMMDKLKWKKHNVDELDVAIWIVVDSNRIKYFPKKTIKNMNNQND